MDRLRVTESATAEVVRAADKDKQDTASEAPITSTVVVSTWGVKEEINEQ